MSSKAIIYLDKCAPGMKVAETIFNDYGAVIVAQDTVLDEIIIRKLRMLDIGQIKVYQGVEENPNKFKEEYDTQVEVVKDIIKDISSGKNLEMQTVNTVVDSLMDNIKENRDVISCINQVRSADEYTYTHCMNVSLLAMMIGKWLKLGEKKVKDLVYSGLLHDIGKAKVDPAILNKPGKLTPEEYEEMKKHVVYGYRILQEMPDISKDIAMGVLMHHERENGSGYMLGASSQQIHEYAKIIAVADVYDAMTSNRVYRPKVCPFDVFDNIQTGTFGQLDPKVTFTFLNCIANYYIGDICKLSTGETAEIMYINPSDIPRPLVRVDNTYIDLSKETSIKIVDLV